MIIDPQVLQKASSIRQIIQRIQKSYIDVIVTIYGFCEYPIHRDVTMLASMCKLKVGRLSREVCLISMMLIFMYYDVSDVDVHEDGVCDVDHHDFDVDLYVDQGGTWYSYETST